MTATRQEVADRLHSASLHLVRAARSVDAEMGLTPARASALSVLVFGGPMFLGALATVEGVRSPTMSGLVAGLESDGLVRRRQSPDDRRSVVVEATDEGRRLMEQGRARRVRYLEGLLDGLDDDELAVLGRAAELMDDAVRRGPS